MTKILGLSLVGAPIVMAALWGNHDPDCGSSATQNLIVQIAKDNPGNKLTNYILQHDSSLWAQIQNGGSNAKLLEENLAKQKDTINEANQNSAQMLEASKSVRFDHVQPQNAGSCWELFQTGTSFMQLGLPAWMTGAPSGAWNFQAQIAKAVEIYQNGGDYKAALGLGNLAQCVEPLAPYFIKDKQLQKTLFDLKNQQNNLVSQAKSEQKAADQNIRDSATYWLESIRMTAKDSDTKAVTCAAKLNAKIGDDGANVDITFKVETTTEGKLYATVHNLVDAYQVGVGYIDNPIGGEAR
jgi:hypothetical protein